MRAGRWVVLLLAASVATGVFAVSSQPVERVTQLSVILDEESGLADLERVEQQARALGYDGFERVELPPAYGGTVQREWSADRCLVVAAAVWGRQRVGSFASATGARVGERVRYWRRVRRSYLRRTCQRDAPEAGASADSPARVTITVNRVDRGTGGGELLVFRGAETLALPEQGEEVSAQRVVVRSERDIKDAGQKAAFVLVLLLLVGFTMENAFRRSKEPPSDSVTVRTISVALPADDRAALRPLVEQIREGDTDAVYALRVHLLAAYERASAFQLGRMRDRLAAVDPRVDELCRAFGEHADPHKPAGYRQRELGQCVVSLVLVHRCELPGMPHGATPMDLKIALQHSLPSDPDELVAAEAFLHPRDPSLTLDDAEAAEVLENGRLPSAADAALDAASAPDP